MELKTLLPDNGGRRALRNRRQYRHEQHTADRRFGVNRRSGQDRRVRHRYVLREGVTGLAPNLYS